jgi:DNA-directed RNA polymerase I and III subunit RPAC2
MSVNDYRNQVTDINLEVQAGPSASSATYIFGNEDHTLGNAIRHVLMNHADTEFCGYSVPHPYEPKMNVRLQVKKECSAQGVLLAGLKDLEECALQLDDVFVAAVEAFGNGTAAAAPAAATATAAKGKSASSASSKKKQTT